MAIVIVVPDNEGTEFIFAFGANYQNRGGALSLFITTRKNYNVSFNFTSDSTVTHGYVRAGDVVTIDVDTSQRMGDGFENTENKSQLLMAEDDIIAYASNKQQYSADAYLVLPTDVLGTKYILPAWRTAFYRGGTMVVISPRYDDTSVNITLNGTVVKETFLLNRGEVYQYVGQYDSSSVAGASAVNVDDLTGAVVSSDKPVAVLSGNKRTYIGEGARSSDHIVEMIPPVNTLGQDFMLSSFIERKTDIVRVIAADDNVTVDIYRSFTNSTTSEVLNFTGDFYQIATNESEVMHIMTSSAALVAQYAQSSGIDGALSDPMMALVPPHEQYGNFYSFTTPTGVSAPYKNYVNIIIKSTETSEIYLDDIRLNLTFSDLGLTPGDTFYNESWVQDNWTPIGTTGYSARTIAVVHGTHSIYHSNPTVTFYAMMYGQVIYESYGFPAGTRLASIGAYCKESSSVSNDGLDNDCDGSIDEELLNGIDDDGDGMIVLNTTASRPAALTTPTSNSTNTTSTMIIEVTDSPSTSAVVTDSTVEQSSMPYLTPAATTGSKQMPEAEKQQMIIIASVAGGVGSLALIAIATACCCWCCGAAARRRRESKEELGIPIDELGRPIGFIPIFTTAAWDDSGAVTLTSVKDLPAIHSGLLTPIQRLRPDTVSLYAPGPSQGPSTSPNLSLRVPGVRTNTVTPEAVENEWIACWQSSLRLFILEFQIRLLLVNQRNCLIYRPSVLAELVLGNLTCSNHTPDNEGTEFIFPFGSNDENYGGSLEVFVTTRNAGPVAFNFTSKSVTTFGSVSTGEVVTIDVDTGQRMSTGFENIEIKSQVLMAEKDIIAYASNKQSKSADAFLVLPTDVLGTTYVLPSCATTYSDSGTMIVITPVQDNTNINITLRGTVIKPTFTLQRGEVYQYLGVYGNSVSGSTVSVDDVTGAVVMSDKPISVLSGNRRAHIGDNARSSDHVVEMIPPINTLGSEFLISTFYERGSDMVRIIAECVMAAQLKPTF
ncbi:uncharacterized protein [Watersipora subatra]|uniref:uncharacterized protein n=1 Tax=Watersipora subatra TaxID=2589382 RepID=UPI00355B1134